MDTVLAGLVAKVVGDAGTGEDDEHQRHDRKYVVVAPEGWRGRDVLDAAGANATIGSQREIDRGAARRRDRLPSAAGPAAFPLL